MTVEIWSDQLNSADLILYHCGEQACTPGHSYGPAVRDHFLIHYILAGKGVFEVGERVYHLAAGQGFLIWPDEVTYYHADLQSPWHYVWVGFQGLKAQAYLRQAGLSANRPILRYDEDDRVRVCFEQMMATDSLVASSAARDVRLLGLLYCFLSLLIESSGQQRLPSDGVSQQERYAYEAIAYVERNYSRAIGVAEIAEHVALNRSYFGSIFKDCLGVTPQRFLISFRMRKACALLENLGLSIGDVARSVGYRDPLAFSKMFKQVIGLSPSTYRAGISARA